MVIASSDRRWRWSPSWILIVAPEEASQKTAPTRLVKAAPSVRLAMRMVWVRAEWQTMPMVWVGVTPKWRAAPIARLVTPYTDTGYEEDMGDIRGAGGDTSDNWSDVSTEGDLGDASETLGKIGRLGDGTPGAGDTLGGNTLGESRENDGQARDAFSIGVVSGTLGFGANTMLDAGAWGVLSNLGSDRQFWC
ncbi:unnamed protein product [Ilex paraguariensis]|uniref:Uncharacterized protein n=1 Tax=Ilex paraguariensis TaxID=185542 RepID=A0ABC8RJC9_9AQUA